MEDNYTPTNVRERLILAGLKELDKNGIREFSLRRVALAAGVSCAAPYRHFKDKDELISAIAAYVLEGWSLLCGQIVDIYHSDFRVRLVELSLAGLRFWIANGKFRTILLSSDAAPEGAERLIKPQFDEPIISAVRDFCLSRGRTDVDTLAFGVLALIYGSVTMVDGGYDSVDNAARNLSFALDAILG